MIYKRFSIQVVSRLFLLLLNMFAVTLVVTQTQWIFTPMLMGSIMVGQVYELLRFINKTNHDLSKFLFAIRHNDYSFSFPTGEKGTAFDELYDSFREIMNSYRQARIEKETQYQYFKAMVEHLTIGIISLSGDQDIVLMNQEAERILDCPNTRTWARLAQRNPEFATALENIFEGGHQLIEVPVDREVRHLSVYVSAIRLSGDPFKVITFQNIKSEIELKEIEAWHKLIRILTHEIMNSVTPIASLTETVLMLLQTEEGQPRKLEDLDEEVIADVRMALETIDKRSNGLLSFVADFRKVTRVPVPEKQRFRVEELFERVVTLMRPEANKRQVQLDVKSVVRNLDIYGDPVQVEQMVINLVLNGMDAVEGREDPKVVLTSYVEGSTRIIEVTDNGIGIEPHLLDKVFVPFFSTKDDGSGIGLSLSRHIMKLHGGTIRVKSQPGQYTSFFLDFRTD